MKGLVLDLQYFDLQLFHQIRFIFITVVKAIIQVSSKTYRFSMPKVPSFPRCVLVYKASGANKGVREINEHLNTYKHNFFNFKHFVISSSADLLIRTAECAFVYHIVCHHKSFNSLDCTCTLNYELFSESDPAKEFRVFK